MKSKSCLLGIWLLFALANVVDAQNPANPKDPSLLYKKIGTYSSKRKITNLLSQLLFKPAVASETPLNSFPREDKCIDYQKFEDRVIRSITITTLDPFGYSVTDTLKKPHTLLSKTGNAIHKKTLDVTVRNHLLIKKFDRFDTLLLKESERLLRNLNYVHDVSLYATLEGINNDSVDVFVYITDLWSIIIDGSISTNRMGINLADKNLLGMGHTFSNKYTHNLSNGTNSYSTYYDISNIRNYAINLRVAYSIDEKMDFSKSISVERPFFTAYAKWAGGISFLQKQNPDWVHLGDATEVLLNSRINIGDCWFAGAWQIFKGSTETEITTKMILSARYLNQKYLKKPAGYSEFQEYFMDQDFLLGQFGISYRKYVKQKYVFRFGKTEYVPVGGLYSLIGGYQIKKSGRWYWGAQHSWGSFLPFGYLSTQLEFGTFLHSSRMEESVFSGRISYFSPLLNIGKWKFRQFVRPEFTIGFNRSNYDVLTLNDGFGLNGFNSKNLLGKSRLLATIQTQFYSNWNLLGFRFGPYINATLGMLGSEKEGFSNSKLYSQFGVGILIRNDYLVFDYLQISFAYYPSIPGQGNNVFKLNPVKTTDFGHADFVLGKPEIIDYQ